MKKLLLLPLVVFGYALLTHTPKPKYDAHADRWICPAGYEAFASEQELEQGREFVHCVK